jgi:hypothetical protein
MSTVGKYSIRVDQRNSANNAYIETFISGSNLVLTTDSNGIITGSHFVPTSSYSLTASYASNAGSSLTTGSTYPITSSFAITASYALAGLAFGNIDGGNPSEIYSYNSNIDGGNP